MAGQKGEDCTRTVHRFDPMRDSAQDFEMMFDRYSR